ncbi:hypothetical protein C8T65DRAFT_88817 [Cerioporus squamosus]|nr:hypothetical protein C8T65DRAFT_88817 [Cerioporus squamosus]
MLPGEFIAPARCNGCQQIFPSKNQAEEHARRAGHWSYKCITRICTECMKTFAKNEDQQQHIGATGHMKGESQGSLNGYDPVSAPGSIGTSSMTRPCVCEDCNLKFASADVLTSHRQLAHAAFSSAQGLVNTPMCPNCRAQFNTSTELVAHVTKTDSCSICKICLQPHQTLEEHYWDSKMHPKCSPCIKGFENQAALSAHKKECLIAPAKSSNKKPASGKAPMMANSRSLTPAPPSVSASKPAFKGPSSLSKPLGGAWARRVNGAKHAIPPATFRTSASTPPDRFSSPGSSMWGPSASAGTSSDGSPMPSARGTPKSSGSGGFNLPTPSASAREVPTSAGPGDDAAQDPSAWSEPRPSSTGSDDVRPPPPANWVTMLAPSAERNRTGRSSLGAGSSAASVFESARGTPNQDEGSSVVEPPAPPIRNGGEYDPPSAAAPFSSACAGNVQLGTLNGAKNDNPPKHLNTVTQPDSEREAVLLALQVVHAGPLQ